MEWAAFGSLGVQAQRGLQPVLTDLSPDYHGGGVFYVEAKIDPTYQVHINPGMTATGYIDTGKTSWMGRLFGW